MAEFLIHLRQHPQHVLAVCLQCGLQGKLIVEQMVSQDVHRWRCRTTLMSIMRTGFSSLCQIQRRMVVFHFKQEYDSKNECQVACLVLSKSIHTYLEINGN